MLFIAILSLSLLQETRRINVKKTAKNDLINSVYRSTFVIKLKIDSLLRNNNFE